MTDYPRFQMSDREARRSHRDHHGAPLVDLVFLLADMWPRRNQRIDRTRGAGSQLRRPARRWMAGCVAGLLLAAGMVQVWAQDTVRVRGTVEKVVDGVYIVRTRDDKLMQLRVADDAKVAASVKSSLTDIRPGVYVGIAALPQADGTLRAIEAHIFHESMRGTAEGHRAWDLLPKSTMTNAVVHEIVSAVDGHAVTLRYADGQKQVLIPPGITIVTYLPGSVDELKPGAAVFVPGVTNEPDGTWLAQRVMVGRDVAPPQ